MSIFQRLRMIRKLKTNIWICACIYLAASCSSSGKTYNPQKKYPPAVLQADYTLFRHILEKLPSKHLLVYDKRQHGLLF